MIICPNCNGENADEAAHCGHCGTQLQEGGKKTMFGMAALNAGDIQAAAQAAQAKREAATALPPLSSDPFAKTEALPGITPDMGAPNFGAPPLSGPPNAGPPEPAPPAKDPFADDFAALEAQFGSDFSADAPVNPTPSPMSTGLSGTSTSNDSNAQTIAAPPVGAPPMGGLPMGGLPMAGPPTGGLGSTPTPQPTPAGAMLPGAPPKGGPMAPPKKTGVQASSGTSPMVLAGIIGVIFFLLGGGAALFFLVIKPMLGM